MNIVIIKGNTTRDPELRYTPNGTAICAVGVAVNEWWTDAAGEKQERVNFFDVDFWGKTGETVAQYFRKGKPILVQGKLRQDTWDDKQTGQKRSKIKIVAERFEFCGGDKGGAPAGEGVQNAPNHEAAQPDPVDAGDDVPF